MADAAASVAQQANPDLPGAEQVIGEVKDDTSNAEKWPFSKPQSVREDQVRNAVNFLSHPKVRGTPMVQRFSFLERKGLTKEEIDEAFRRCPDPPTSDTIKTSVLPEGKLVTAPPTQAHSPGMYQATVSPSQPAQHYISGPSSAITPARSGYHWSQLILGAGLIAAAGAGTGYFFQKVLAPKFRGWLRDVVLDEKKATETKSEVQGKSFKLSPLEEAVGAAAAAANAAAAAAAEVANTSREVLKLQAEEWQHLRSLIKSLDTKTEELKSTLTIMSKNSQDAQGQMVSVHAEEAIGANYYKGSVKTYQRMTPPAEQVQMQQGIQVSKSMATGNGVDRSQSNGHSATFNNYVSQTEAEPWRLEQEIGSAGTRTIESGRGGGPLGRQGWVPPPAPQTVMPGAASAIRYQKPITVNEVKPTIISEEKAVDSLTSFEQRSLPLMPGSPSAIRLQNPIASEETKPSIVADEKEMDAVTSFDQPKMPEVAEVTEITSVDKEIPFSSMQEWIDDGGLAPLKVPETHTDGL